LHEVLKVPTAKKFFQWKHSFLALVGYLEMIQFIFKKVPLKNQGESGPEPHIMLQPHSHTVKSSRIEAGIKVK